MKVFISHAIEKDLDLAKKLNHVLDQAGIEGYLAITKPKYDTLIRNKIMAEIKLSDHLIAILTENSSDSASVNQELGFALREGISPIIMREKNAKEGVLTLGLDTQEFSRDSFEDSCKKVLNHIQEKGPRPKIPEDMSEILKKMVQIEAKLDNKKPQVTTGYSDKYPEVQWYTEIMKFCNDNDKNIDIVNEGVIPDSDVLRRDVKEHYSKIQMLRQEIEEISESYEKGESITKGRLLPVLREKRAELKDLLENLSDLWKMYSD